MDKPPLRLFKEKFGNPQATIFAPGRANIIGEHTDYNDGFVLPFAIGQGVWFYGKSNENCLFNIMAADTHEESMMEMDGSVNVTGWEKYFSQVLQVLSSYQIRGADIVFGGNLPIGAGVSSSSAITCGFVALINELNGLQLSQDDLIIKAVEAERGYGVRGGIMDQYTIFNGRKDKAILIDCRKSTHEYVDFESGEYQFYLINTNVKHNLIHTDYNNRREECEKAVVLLNQHYRQMSALRDLTLSDLPEISHLLDDGLFAKVNFVVQENNRVLLARKAMLSKDYNTLGQLLYASHEGLSKMYNVSCDELDWLVNYTFNIENCLGARMMGGGFGGCTINLIKGNLDEDVISDITLKYKHVFGISPDIIPVQLEDGILYKTN